MESSQTCLLHFASTKYHSVGPFFCGSSGCKGESRGQQGKGQLKQTMELKGRREASRRECDFQKGQESGFTDHKGYSALQSNQLGFPSQGAQDWALVLLQPDKHSLLFWNFNFKRSSPMKVNTAVTKQPSRLGMHLERRRICLVEAPSYPRTAGPYRLNLPTPHITYFKHDNCSF